MFFKFCQKKKNDLNNLKCEAEFNEHKVSLDDLCKLLDTNIESGLSTDQVSKLLLKHGQNALTPPKQTPEIIKFLKQMSSGFAILLWFGAFFSFVSFGIEYSQDIEAPLDSIWLGTTLILVIIGTGCFQYFQEAKSDKIMDSFKKMIPQEAEALRDGKKITINASQLVPGDYVFVKIGDRVPADIRIVKSEGLKVDNSSLTGECEPLHRTPNCTHDNPLETKNLAFFSTYAVEGNGTGIVLRTGDQTAMGRIANLASNINQNQSHLAGEIKHFIRIVTVVAFGFGGLFFGIMIGLGYSIGIRILIVF